MKKRTGILSALLLMAAVVVSGATATTAVSEASRVAHLVPAIGGDGGGGIEWPHVPGVRQLA